MRMKTEDLITRDECLTIEEAKILVECNSLRYYVYFLIDPFSYQIKYVGEGQGYRLSHHQNMDKTRNAGKQKWLNSLRKIDKSYYVVIWEFYKTKKMAEDQEDIFIYAMGRKGIDNKGTLLNIKRGRDKHFHTPFKSQKAYIREVAITHSNKYDYSITSYKGNSFPIDILCPIHGKFTQTAGSHWQGAGCPLCSTGKWNNNIFITKAESIHGNKYGYDKVVYSNMYSEVSIFCKKCKDSFTQTPKGHIHNKQGCKVCGDKRGVEARKKKE